MTTVSTDSALQSVAEQLTEGNDVLAKRFARALALQIKHGSPNPVWSRHPEAAKYFGKLSKAGELEV